MLMMTIVRNDNPFDCLSVPLPSFLPFYFIKEE